MKKRRFFPILFTGVFIVGLVVVLFFIPKNKKEIQNLSTYVNPMIGTGGHGHTFPGATMPFGMVQLSPDSRLTGWDGCSAYHYSDSIIYGFSHTHLSGTGCSDYGDILLMPMSGHYSYENGATDESMGYSSIFSHETEKARAGYYAVHLETPNVDVELTTTARTGFHKYHYNNNEDSAFVILDLKHRDQVLEAGLSKVNETDISGFRRSAAWARDQHVYFYIRFSQPIKSFNARVKQGEKNKNYEFYGKDIVSAIGFKQANNQEILVKVGISAVSIEGAKRNLEKEAKGVDFNTALELASSTWNDELSKIIVSGTEHNKRVFYSALYHSFVAPNIFSDVDGQYRGTDLKVHMDKNHDQYTVFSLWDTYRATHPLFTLTQTKRTGDFIQTFLNQYQQGGKLPVWELAANYTGCMIGYHSIPVIADAYQKGINNFDAELALKAMQHSATMEHLGLPAYMSKGYIGIEDEPSSVSKALEYAFDDWCIAAMAKSMGKEDIYQEYSTRAQYYKNHFDPQSGLMRARVNGSWFTPFDPNEVNFHYTEANAWQYSFYVPQDIHTWMDMLGGPQALDSLLDALFAASHETTGRHQADITGLIGQYAHGNEPSHHIAYLYNYCGKPWKTQAMVKKIMTEMYTNLPDGYIGNEDCGQMSAWYVMSAMGLYPVNPANGIYDFGSPMFDTISLQLENSNNFKIIAENLSDKNIYIQSISLNGAPYNKMYITHQDIVAGGELKFVMGDKPNKTFGTETENIFQSRIATEEIVTSPVMLPAQRAFVESLDISISSSQNNDVTIFYTTDGTNPTIESKVYETPIHVSDDMQIRAIAMRGDKQSGVVVANYKKIDDNVKIELNSNYSNQYNAGGNNALIDGVRGGNGFRTGEWQGYEAQDLEAIIDLGKNTTVMNIGAGFIQDIKSWIWIPQQVDFYTAGADKQFTLVESKTSTTAEDLYGSHIENFDINIKPTNIRYIKVVAKSYGKIKDWHVGVGGDSWIFADEIYWE